MLKHFEYPEQALYNVTNYRIGDILGILGMYFETFNLYVNKKENVFQYYIGSTVLFVSYC